MHTDEEALDRVISRKDSYDLPVARGDYVIHLQRENERYIHVITRNTRIHTDTH